MCSILKKQGYGEGIKIIQREIHSIRYHRTSQRGSSTKFLVYVDCLGTYNYEKQIKIWLFDEKY
jgi:hypothetical protein